VSGQRRTGIAESGDDVDHAGREAGLFEDLAEQQRGERGLLGRFEDDGVAGSQRGRQLERGHQQREVPRHDEATYAYRIPQGVGVELATGDERHRDVDGGAEDLGGQSRVVAEDVGRPLRVDRSRDAGGLAVVDRLELAELLGPLRQDVADAPQQALALVGLHPGPVAVVEGLAGGADGTIHVGGVAMRDVGDGGGGGRIVGGEGLAGRGVDPFTTDQHLAIGRNEIPDPRRQLGFGNGGHSHLLVEHAQS
jgi:ParB family chromosome partitioning protein